MITVPILIIHHDKAAEIRWLNAITCKIKLMKVYSVKKTNYQILCQGTMKITEQ